VGPAVGAVLPRGRLDTKELHRSLDCVIGTIDTTALVQKTVTTKIYIQRFNGPQADDKVREAMTG
jgi:hypothetical protein